MEPKPILAKSKSQRRKRVSFRDETFDHIAQVIEIESYKKYNAQSYYTCTDCTVL